ncbi:MAG: alpha/beta hydrolase, partial [Leptolyngbya sp. SIO1D8]|nr:alpha/beta hydrolase [Leptolyngbya sp. SIO1D8]
MKNKKPKAPLIIIIIQRLFPMVEKVLPPLAYRWAFRLFFKPMRFPTPPRELSVTQKAVKFRLNSGDLDIQCYSWGQGPVVLFVHGWAGRGTQFFKFVQPFVDKGFKVVAFDGPSHGASSGKSTDIIEFEQVLKSLEEYYGEICAIITHSFGGAATIFAMSKGLKVQNLVNISSPTNADKIIAELLKKINGSPKVAANIDKMVRKKYGRPFNSFSSDVQAEHLPPFNLLLIHDKNDKEVGIDQAEGLKALVPGAEMMVTTL